ncbi:unnamed protein product [Dovyalis caffra]|uniref:Uncharacterized protein n=1 Tax=Dovyalis caffra TaxID=77055 RepID=A0AAV1RHM1_9ROSI|nr:unnamed protein product [Dovyalis caffra]
MTFRSTKEVLNFILYNAYPDKKQITKKSALEENPLAQGSGKKRRTFSHEKEASSSSILCRKSNSIQIEEGFIELNVFRTKDDFTESKIIIQKEKDFPKSNVVETEDDFIELNATESDEDIYTARQLFQHPLGEETKELKRNKREGTYQPSVQGESSQYPFACQALENSGDGKENKTVTNKNVSEEEIGADVIQTPTTWAVIEKKDNVTSSSKPVEENTGKKGDVEDIFGQLGDLQDASVAEQVLSKQFNQEDDAYKDLYFF